MCGASCQRTIVRYRQQARGRMVADRSDRGQQGGERLRVVDALETGFVDPEPAEARCSRIHRLVRQRAAYTGASATSRTRVRAEALPPKTYLRHRSDGLTQRTRSPSNPVRLTPRAAPGVAATPAPATTRNDRSTGPDSGAPPHARLQREPLSQRYADSLPAGRLGSIVGVSTEAGQLKTKVFSYGGRKQSYF